MDPSSEQTDLSPKSENSFESTAAEHLVQSFDKLLTIGHDLYELAPQFPNYHNYIHPDDQTEIIVDTRDNSQDNGRLPGSTLRINDYFNLYLEKRKNKPMKLSVIFLEKPNPKTKTRIYFDFNNHFANADGEEPIKGFHLRIKRNHMDSQTLDQVRPLIDQDPEIVEKLEAIYIIEPHRVSKFVTIVDGVNDSRPIVAEATKWAPKKIASKVEHGDIEVIEGQLSKIEMEMASLKTALQNQLQNPGIEK